MAPLTAEGQRVAEDLAQRYGVSVDAVVTLLHSLVAGGGTMAQFSHPDLGGMGQWSLGGMTMVGDMFNNALKAKVDGLCSELSAILAREPLLARPQSFQSQNQSQGGGFAGTSSGYGSGVSLFVPQAGGGGGYWWPDGLGSPSSTGAQNDIRYAVFPASRRLAVQIGGRTTVYDTLDHQIGGVSQQQSGDASVTFTSQWGLVRVSDLPVVEPGGGPATAPAHAQAAPESYVPPVVVPAAAPMQTPMQAPVETPMEAVVPKPVPGVAASAGSASSDGDIFAKIERLADLRSKGILSEEEFAAKKSELLARL